MRHQNQMIGEEDPETDLDYLPVGTLLGLLCYLDQKGLHPLIPGQNLLKMIPQFPFYKTIQD